MRANLDRQSEEYRKQLTEEARKKAKDIIKNAHEESAAIMDGAKRRAE